MGQRRDETLIIIGEIGETHKKVGRVFREETNAFHGVSRRLLYVFSALISLYATGLAYSALVQRYLTRLEVFFYAMCTVVMRTRCKACSSEGCGRSKHLYV